MSLSVVGSDAPMSGARLPPHHLQAEESLLGSMLLPSQANADAEQSVPPEAF